MKENFHSKKAYQDLVMNLPDLVSIVDHNFCYTFVNAKYQEYHGVDLQKILGMKIEILLGKDAFTKTIKDNLIKAFSGEKISYKSWFNFSAKGKCYTEVNYIPLYLREGTFVSVQVRILSKRPAGEDFSIKIDDQGLDEVKIELEHLMSNKHVYRNTALKLNNLAVKLNVQPHYLSHLIHKKYDKSFTQFINEYRINEAVEILLKSETNFSLEGIAKEVGFKSKSAFYESFKRIKGTTPGKFANN